MSSEIREWWEANDTLPPCTCGGEKAGRDCLPSCAWAIGEEIVRRLAATGRPLWEELVERVAGLSCDQSAGIREAEEAMIDLPADERDGAAVQLARAVAECSCLPCRAGRTRSASQPGRQG